MGTSTQVDALGDTLTVPGAAAPPAAPASQSDVSATSHAAAPPVSSECSNECQTLDSGNAASSDARGHDVSRGSLPTASARPAELGGGCLSDDAILQYRQGELDAAQLEAVDRHLDACARCRELVELIIADDSPDSSQHVTLFQRGFVVAQRYQVEQFVGKGGMGEVYAAIDQMTSRRVALKTVLCTATDDLRAVRKLLDEVVNAQRVAHPHVFKIYDLHEHRDELRGRTPFFTMEYIEGESLRARLKRDGVLAVAEARTLACQLLAGLGAAHAKGVLHLDFKVDNVMLRSPGGEAVIMDFGLSRASDVQSRQRTSERLQGAGTLPYMSLEQLECRPDLGPASDVYSFGVVLYEVLTGRLPFQAPSYRAILLAQLRERPAPPSQYAPVSPELDAFVLKCLSRAPKDRFADASQALAALEALPRWEKPAPLPKRRARWLGLVALVGSVSASLVVLSGALRWSAHGPPRQERVLQPLEAAVLVPAKPGPKPGPERASVDRSPELAPPSPAPPAPAPQAEPVSHAKRAAVPPQLRAEPIANGTEAKATPVSDEPPEPPTRAAAAPSRPAVPRASSGSTSSAVSSPRAAPPPAAPDKHQLAPARAATPSDWIGPPPQHVPHPQPL